MAVTEAESKGPSHASLPEGAPVMPTIAENAVLAPGQPVVHGQPSVSTLSPPDNTSSHVLSARASSITLVPPNLILEGGQGVSTKSSATTLVSDANTKSALPAKPAPVAAPAPSSTPDPLPSQLPPPPPAAASKATEKGEKGSWWSRIKRPRNPFAVKDQTKTNLKNFLRIFTYSTWTDRLFIFLAVVASICTGVTMPLMNVVFGRVFSSFTGYDKQGNAVAMTEDMFMREILTCVIYLVYIFVARLVLDYVAFLGFRMTSLRISAAIRLAYMRSLFAQPISTLDVFPPGQAAAVITTTANTLQAGISERLAGLLQSATLVVSATVISFWYSWSLTLVTSSGMVFIIIVYSASTPFLVRVMNRVQDVEIKAATVASEIFGSIRMVEACGAEAKMARRYERWVHESRRVGLKMAPVVAVQQAAIFFAIFATFALSFWYTLSEYVKGNVNSPQTLVVVLFSVMMMTGAIGGITTPLSAAARAAASASIFYSIIDIPVPDTSGLKDPDASAAEDIVLEHVNFAYPSRPGAKVLDDLSLRLPAGKMTAIVGPSGSGKSTIVALLERWYELNGDPQKNPRVLDLRSGTITTGGVHLKDIDLKWWRSQIGLVQQEPFLFNDTIYRNVEHGLVGTQWEDAPEDVKRQLVQDACKEAFADEFIARLPDAYETVAGDAGIKLSGGQRQRLAIARAIVRRPRLLVLDEATSAIDVRGEQMVQAALDRVSRGRTTVTIAHRLSTVKKADNIVVLRRGRVVEQGTHEALLAVGEGGAYWALATAQQLVMGGGGAGEEDEAEPTLASSSEPTYSEKEGKSLEVVVAEESGGDSGSATLAASHEVQGGGKGKDRGLIGSFGMLLSEQKGQWPWYLVLLIGALIAGASAPVQAYLFAMLISLFSLFGEPSWLQTLTSFWCLMFTVLAIAVGLSYFALGWSSTTTSFNIIHHYRKEYIRNVLAKPVSFFDEDDHNVGALTARLATDPTQLQQLLGMNMAFVLISVLNVVGCLAVSFAFGWKLTLVTVCTSMPVILGAAFIRVRYEQQFERMNNRVFAESAKFATESIGAFRTVSALTLEDTICRRYQLLLQDHIRRALFQSSLSTFVFALSDSIALLCMAFVLWYGGKLLADREYWPFQYVVVYIAVMQGGLGAGTWLSFGPNIAQASVAANRIIDLRREDHPDGRLVSLDVGDIGDEDKGVRIEFRNVWFRYPTRDAPVLNGLSMTIEKGQFAAVVGPSGSGKTTVVSLLERFYRASAGQVLYNGLSVANLSLRDYRRDISLVAQEPSLFDGTLRENILLGIDEEERPVTDAELHQACEDAGIHEFIASLPDGYSTEVGSKGVALSGGQKQRVSIARALIRRPRLLLLDEATSNLDSETERQVQAVFERTRGSRTMVVVAHRLATVQNADVIFVLGDGRVLEKGDHAALLRKRGVYYQMCQSQALDR